MELTDKQINRQDYVDNEIFELIRSLDPSRPELGSSIKWDIEMISEIRDSFQRWIVDKLGLCTEQEFYPYLEEENEH